MLSKTFKISELKESEEESVIRFENPSKNDSIVTSGIPSPVASKKLKEGLVYNQSEKQIKVEVKIVPNTTSQKFKTATSLFIPQKSDFFVPKFNEKKTQNSIEKQNSSHITPSENPEPLQ